MKSWFGAVSIGAICVGAVSSSVLALSTVALAETNANEVLQKMDVALNRAQDQWFEYDMTDSPPGKEERHLALEVFIKGTQRVSSFTAPADVKGTRVLIVSPSQMYVYMPAYKKVRRIASHVTEQGFMGTTYSNDDFSITTYADKYSAKLLAETPEIWKIEAVQKPDVKVPYPKIELTIAKDHQVPLELRYFTQEGVNVKTETRSEYTCEGAVCTPRTLKMVDNTDKGHSTSIVRKKWKVNSGLSDQIFSVRDLQRGH